MRVKIGTEVLGDNAQIMGSGFIDTTHGGVMNVDEAISMVLKKARQDFEKMQRRSANVCRGTFVLLKVQRR